ncbi:MAG TPA: serine hydrolase [Pyrinomonadaceae bacterium]|nr:serine hydrolase [Pyrinomonadaceae bacterium]
MRKTISLLLLFAYMLPFTVLGQTSVDTQVKRVEQGLLPAVLIKGDPSFTLEERMKQWKVPGLSVAVVKDFKVEWARSYGIKDIESKEPVTTETLFQAGSISKPVAAMVALKRVQQGKITLDENINNKLVTWKLPDNEFTAKKKVTLANLLSHTAGLTVHGFPGYAVDEKVPTLPQVLDGTEPANTAAVRVDMEPGTKFRYSGGGTTIAQLAIMDIEKKPYPQIAKETVLGPLNMTNSTYSQPLPDDWRKKAASGHRGDGALVAGKIHVYPEMAAAGLWTTPTDLAKFGIEVQLSYAGKSNKVLPKELIDKMVTPFMEQVGLGFFIDKRGNSVYFGHDGADEGFRAMMLMHREKGYGAVIMVNSDNGQIMPEVMRSIAREYNWDEFLPAVNELISLDAATLDQYVGRFQVNPDRILTVAREEGKLIVRPTADLKFELLPVADGTFIRREGVLTYRFVKGAAGVSELKVTLPAGNIVTAAKVAADALIPFEHLNAGNFEKALAGYRQIKKDTPDNAAINQARINGLGYGYMRAKKMPEALFYFKLNVEFYPNDSDVYDSLGEGYMTNGDKELAIANYKKSLELNPKNTNAAEALKKLNGAQN